MINDSLDIKKAAKRAAIRERVRKWRAANPEKARAASRESVRRIRQKDPERMRQHNERWKERNPGRAEELNRLWIENNRERYAAKARVRGAIRNRRLASATPQWVDRGAITEICANCPQGYEVDHIEPLKGKDRCGLHVPWNLQYLTPRENRIKGNRC